MVDFKDKYVNKFIDDLSSVNLSIFMSRRVSFSFESHKIFFVVQSFSFVVHFSVVCVSSSMHLFFRLLLVCK